MVLNFKFYENGGILRGSVIRDNALQRAGQVFSRLRCLLHTCDGVTHYTRAGFSMSHWIITLPHSLPFVSVGSKSYMERTMKATDNTVSRKFADVNSEMELS